MKLLTVQSRKVLNILLKNKTYEADFYYMNHLKPYTIEAYQLLMKNCNYNAVPIFCMVYDKISSLYGTHVTNGSVILELDVPDEVVHIQSFFGWIELQMLLVSNIEKYSTEERKNAKICPRYIDDFSHAIQATIPYILPEWLIAGYKYNNDFASHFNECLLLDENFAHQRLIKLKEFT